MILYIWKWCLQHNKNGGMGIVIKKLTHFYNLTHKDYKQKWWGFFFLVGFWIFRNFWLIFPKFPLSLSLFLSFLIFLIFPPYFSIFHSFSLKKWGVFIGEMRKWEASISLTCYTCASLPRQRVASIRASHFCHLNSLFRCSIWRFGCQDIVLERKVTQS